MIFTTSQSPKGTYGNNTYGFYRH